MTHERRFLCGASVILIGHFSATALEENRRKICITAGKIPDPLGHSAAPLHIHSDNNTAFEHAKQHLSHEKYPLFQIQLAGRNEEL